MGLIDSHAHLTAKVFDADRAAVIDRAQRAGVDRIISIATDLNDAEAVLKLAQSDDRVSAVIGIHPHEAGKVQPGDWDRLERFCGESSVLAIGEMGLDYHYDFADRSVQAAVFEKQLELAGPTNKPIVIHCREAHADVVSILKNAGYANRRVVFHCFTGNAGQSREIADHGWRISFTGVVTFKSARELQEIAVQYPADQIMVETDSPYLSPEPVRKVRPNEPAHVVHVARFLAKLRGTPFEEFVEQSAANTIQFFG